MFLSCIIYKVILFDFVDQDQEEEVLVQVVVVYHGLGVDHHPLHHHDLQVPAVIHHSVVIAPAAPVAVPTQTICIGI